MNVIDIAPFGAFLLVGVVSGRWVAGSWACLIGLALPVAHLVLSVVTGRAGDDLFSYVLPVNAALLGSGALGVLAGRSLRPRVRIDQP